MPHPQEIRLRNYAAVADDLNVVAQGLGVAMSEETVINQRLGMEFMALMDDTQDDGGNRQKSDLDRYWASLYTGDGAEDPGGLSPAFVERAIELHSRITDEQALQFHSLGQIL